MPIKGLTEVRRLPRLGKIHLGVKAKNPKGVEYPKAVDYFVCPPEVQKVFGEQPKQLRIMFPVEDETRFAQQWYRRYSSLRGLVCKGDGEIASCLMDKATGAAATRESKDVEFKEGLTCLGEACPEYQAKNCRRVMNLQFLLAEVVGLGVWQIDTSSFFSITNINTGIELVRRACGRVAMLPLLLSVKSQEVSPQGVKKTVWTLHLEIGATLLELRQQAALPAPGVVIPAPEVPVPGEAGDGENGTAVVLPGVEERPEDLFPLEAEVKPQSPQDQAMRDATLQELRGQIRVLAAKGPIPNAGSMRAWWEANRWGYTLTLDYIVGDGSLPKEARPEHLAAFRDELRKFQAQYPIEPKVA